MSTNIRLVIGRDVMSGFAGLSDGDRFGTLDGRVWVVRTSTQHGITLREEGMFSNVLPGFCNLDSYMAFVQAVNLAATNGIAIE